MPIASSAARGRNGWVEIVKTAPKLENPEIAPPGGITRPPPNPVTGKPNRPGALLERRARQYAQTHAPAAEAPQPRRKKPRDYEALIARALEDMGMSDDDG